MTLALANPIYDSVFKFLMEDLDIALEIISAIINKEIISIKVQPQENTVQLEGKSFTVYRLDFIAVIKTPDGDKKVLIELQKAKFSTDIIRFRKYLGEQYKKDVLPIITIYFLGHILDNFLPAILEVNRTYKDRLTGKEINYRNEFIESLTHDSFVIQIPAMKLTIKTKLEKILSVFEQNKLSEDKHIVYYDYPIDDSVQEKITRRLNYAASSEKLKREMDIEEEILLELETLERRIEDQEKLIEDKDKVIEDKDKVIEEKDKALAEKDKLIQELLTKLSK
jgi:hypothetical protein